MTRLWNISANTFIQTIRRPVYTIVLLATYGALALNVELAANSQGIKGISLDDNQLLINLGLSTLMVSGLILAAFSAAGALTTEIEQRTILTVVTKPVGRSLVLGGKFLGVMAAVFVGIYLCSMAYMMTVRQGVMTRGGDTYDLVVVAMGVGSLVLAMLVAGVGNYLFGWSFCAAFTLCSLLFMRIGFSFVCMFAKGWIKIPYGSCFDPQLQLVVVLMWMAIAVLTAITVAASTRFGQAATLGVALGLYALSLVSEAVFRPHVGDNVVALAIYRLVPNMSYFFALDQMMLKQPITGQYITYAGTYAGAYVLAALLVGMALFQTREVDASETAAVAPTLVNFYAWTMRLLCVVAGLAGLAIAGSLLAGKHNLHALIPAAALMAAAVLGWLWAGLLGRGVVWALHLLVVVIVVQLVYTLVYLLFLHPGKFEPLTTTIFLFLSVGHAVYVLIMFLRRSTAAHFGRKVRKKAKVPGQLIGMSS